jgi:hypothetical protein
MITPELLQELKDQMSLSRLAKTGLFQRMAVPDEAKEVRREIKLHRAVLDKALVDSFSLTSRIRVSVEGWLRLDNPDFKQACERAYLDPTSVFRVFHVIKEVIKGKNAKFRRYGAASGNLSLPEEETNEE